MPHVGLFAVPQARGTGHGAQARSERSRVQWESLVFVGLRYFPGGRRGRKRGREQSHGDDQCRRECWCRHDAQLCACRRVGVCACLPKQWWLVECVHFIWLSRNLTQALKVQFQSEQERMQSGDIVFRSSWAGFHDGSWWEGWCGAEKSGGLRSVDGLERSPLTPRSRPH